MAEPVWLDEDDDLEPLDGELELIGTGASVCDFDGHEWGDAGGGLEICIRCEAERFTV